MFQEKKKILWEIALSVGIVFIPTYFIYQSLAEVTSFWEAQNLWSIALAVCWIVVAAGYYHQGWLVHTKRKSDDVSLVLPSAVFMVQCILFVKGIYYQDWSLIWGAIVVNSGVVFSLFQIWRVRKNS
ncbi:MAG: hypothetical protein NUV53_01105 [Patescibacteria group bacterium]|nr:hypothetical protein [Patescibacteria group bacterium]